MAKLMQVEQVKKEENQMIVIQGGKNKTEKRRYKR